MAAEVLGQSHQSPIWEQDIAIYGSNSWPVDITKWARHRCQSTAVNFRWHRYFSLNIWAGNQPEAICDTAPPISAAPCLWLRFNAVNEPSTWALLRIEQFLAVESVAHPPWKLTKTLQTVSDLDKIFYVGKLNLGPHIIIWENSKSYSK